MVTIARLFALQKRLSHRKHVIITGEVAVAARGFATWWNVPDITYRCSGPRRACKTFPAVTVKQIKVDVVVVRHVTGGLQTTIQQARLEADLFFAPIAVVIADLARTSHPLQTFVGTCSLLRQECGFNRHRQTRSRRLEADLKARLLRVLEGQRGRRSHQLTKAIIRAADAGTESPMEAAFLWALNCLLHPRRRNSLTTQQRSEAGGRTYYVDISIPQLSAGVEIDGAVKAGNTPETFHRHADNYTNRHQALTEAGWTIIHVTAASLNTPDLLWVTHQAAVKARIAPRGSRPRGRGSLFKQMTPTLTCRNRRY